MDRTFKLVIEYDGTDYCGWQRQPNGRTIQQTIEDALARMTRQAVVLTGSGRTDAGVHALGQVAHFSCDTTIAPEALQKGLNSLLPDDIVIRACQPAPIGFHARFDAHGKTYRYTIRNTPLPAAIGRQYAWWIRSLLDTAAMTAAAAHLVGRHDFKSFEAAGSPRAHTIRHISHAEVRCDTQGIVTIDVTADGFLRHMVRNIAGTLAAVGRGKLPSEQIPALLDARDRTLAPPTAPAHGLCLIKVLYSEEGK
ncbi:tRNA pseudouridine(38-40) synthase TruA [Desulfatitalea alkaliphila]|uniref:tRNA pseudouridine synthase A n=1 Tax=Desulfatitalea alkaliphila TaxID=2929485 RepID=A0AA41R8K5_9BACT|nr:tRNA pseudouridine(38-40) synthase TruA [Desulfatitalea alkaliphila]MCJ8502976.1 tRNA pseudouridine(38-40) synthase TruA [Desulfatitalea alkaliphila]